MAARDPCDRGADLRAARLWYGILGLVAVAAAVTTAWRIGLRRRGAQIAAAEARMEPNPVVY
jgi:hypothetical protein